MIKGVVMKTYYAKVLVWEDGKKDRIIGISTNANTDLTAHREMMEQIWKWGLFIRKFLVLDTMPKG